MPGLTRRRLGVLVAGLVAIWLVGVFARQVGAASAAQAKADEMRETNRAVATEIAGLQREVELAQQSSFVEQTAHGYGLGGPGEVSFVVDPNAPPLPAGAPGSIGIKESSPQQHRSPLESWLRVLFGSGQ